MQENIAKLEKIVSLKPDRIQGKDVQCKEILQNKYSVDDEVVIYGAGRIGRMLACVLEKNGVKVIGFLDKNAVSIHQENVFLPETFAKQEENRKYPILIALALPIKAVEKIVKYLKELGFKDIENDRALMGCFCEFSMYQESEVILQDYEEEILKAYQLFEEKESREIYCACLKHYITKDVYDALESDAECPYFNLEIPLAKGYSSFVDCGAYTGDSLLDLLKYEKCETYIGFEPDLQNFFQLEARVDDFDAEKKPSEIILYPCAISNENEYLSFDSSASESSSLVVGGNIKVPAVKLDDVLKQKCVDFIKMDIEGAEIAALRGATRIISEQTPDLAICVYHKVTDLWEIPLLLKEMCEDYKFYLRTYNPGAGETVLYATTK